MSRLFYPHIGGIEKHVLEIGRLLIEKGHKVVVITEKHENNLKEKESVEGIIVYRIDTGKDNWFKKFRIWLWLFKHLDLTRRADIVHCHDVFFWYLFFRFLFPFKKIFTTFHGYESYPLKPKNILIHKISEKLSNGNICIGDFIKKWYGTTPTYISYGGVDISRINPSASSGQKSKIKNVNSGLFIGRLDEQTGILTYVEAVKIIKRKIPNFDFLIIGDGSLRNQISGRVRILSSVSNAPEYFQNYNFAFVSRYLSVLEAMAAKRLVFAVYDNPLKEDYLRMSPFSEFIIISNSALELASKISFYLDNLTTQKKKINEAYAWVKKHSWEDVADTYLKLWNKNF